MTKPELELRSVPYDLQLALVLAVADCNTGYNTQSSRTDQKKKKGGGGEKREDEKINNNKNGEKKINIQPR